MSDTINRDAVFFTAACLVASIFNYLYYPAMSHLVDLEGYGELQVVTSLVLQLNTVTLGLNLINVNLIANGEGDGGASVIAPLQRMVFWITVGAGTVIGLASGWLKSYFHFASAWPFLLLVPVLLIEVVSAFWIGYLQGNRHFAGVSANALSIGTGKLLFSVLLVVAGLGVSGGVLGMALGLAAGLAVTKLVAGRRLPPLRHALMWPGRGERAALRPHLPYAIEVIVTLVATSVLVSIDVLLVKHLFPSRFAGRYAGVATVSRIIFFASAPLVAVMLPSITLKDRATGRDVFRRTLTMTAVICVIGVVFCSLFSSWILTLFLGSAFAGSAGWLPLLSLVASLAGMTNVMVNYLLALRSHGALAVSTVSLAVAVPLIVIHHATVPQIVTSTCAGLLVGQILFCAVFLPSATRSETRYRATAR